MRYWQALSFTRTDQLVALARTCEEAGFHGVFVSDHFFFPKSLDSKYPYSEDGAPPFDAETEWPEPFAAIAAMATATSRLRFNTAVCIAPLRHPLVLAKSVSTASVLSDGRVTLGVGVGWIREEYVQFDQDFATRGRRLDEMIEVMRKVWEGGMVEHRGRFYAFPPLQMSPAPPSRIPIHVGGTADAALRRAARNDGWIGSGNDPTELPGLVERFRSYRKEAGLEDAPFEVIAALTAPPDVDVHRRMEDAGVTGLISYPLAYTVGSSATPEQMHGALRKYGEEIIARHR
jgi:probable F420-dependent oxidoreductase